MLTPLKIPPGIVRAGTKYQSGGRWYDGQLVRWHDGTMQPVGGWETHYNITATAEKVSAMHVWRAESDGVSEVYATDSYVFGAVSFPLFSHLGDLTPTGLVTGGRWQLDNFGAYLIGVSDADTRLLYLDTGSATTKLVAVPNAPSCVATVATNERFLVALGADDFPRRVQWADRETTSVWTAADTNEAGYLDLATSGAIMAGRRSRGETLIWTDADLWSMRYIGGGFVHGFTQLGEKCGTVSRNGMGVVGSRAFWMGAKSFYTYDGGGVLPLPCDVGDYVFNGINTAQLAKVACVVNADFNEIWWFYPSGNATQNDRYVSYNFMSGHWMIGELSRSAGVDRGILPYPIWCDDEAYYHERGEVYTGATEPWIESGPFELGDGDVVMHATRLVPDELTVGEAEITFHTALLPGLAETSHGPYTLAAKNDVRFTARQTRLRIDQVAGGWRVGTLRLDLMPGGRR